MIVKKNNLSLNYLYTSINQNRNLIFRMIIRELKEKYKGSVLGGLWTFLNPLLMLAVYTFVFTVVYKARWGIENPNKEYNFAIILFCGLIIHTLFSEIIIRSPGVLLLNINLVKKVIFPLEILTLVNVGSALVNAFFSYLILLIAHLFLMGLPPWTFIFTPITLLILVPLMLGFGWFVSSLGIFVRDIGQLAGLASTIMLFFSPVFYPLNSLSPKIKFLMYLNPITFPIEQTRSVLIYGKFPDMFGIIIYFIISLIFCSIGFLWFQKSRKTFSDII